ncbi:MAG TPA: BTAD domain-containing putative transcriptional regulator [Jatrophihabitans sp.]|nr:BTAD domain-containing putative transcriptional regulator [Jatrophihabitans sp.]
MQIAILGPIEVRDAKGDPIEVAGTRLRTLLSRLALDADNAVSVAALVESIWGDRPPAEETNALQTLVSRLRRVLGDPAVITQSPAGYRLTIDPECIDVHRFECLVEAGAQALRSGAWDDAARDLSAALALWRGPAMIDALEAGQSLVPEATRLSDLRVTAVVDRVEADLHRAVPPAALAAELDALLAAHPLHEAIAGQLMRALAAAGRQADALRVYERMRARLAEELGVDPSAELQEVHLAVLRGERAAPKPATRRTNLKAQLTSFVGREAEVTKIIKSLEQNRLVTLVGPGGAGKTRLASESAARVLDTAPDGIWLVELASVTAGTDVPQAVLGALGLREMHLLDRKTTLSSGDAMTRLLEGLADRRTVIVLDNCEHLIEASARLADQLLADCPGLRILATSREPLGIFGEVLLAVPPLGQPASTASAAEALEYPAVRLFADRAAAVAPDFEIDDTTVGTVIEIVRRLDGLPLAIELAAARLRTMPLADIATRLSDRFRLLTGGSRTALPRHRTLRAVVEWSWDLLDPTERRVAEQLSVFPSGVTVRSASAVCDADPDDVADLLASLIDKSLLQPGDGGRRMRMLETIREYGAERLAERAELGAVRARHAAHFGALLDEAEPHLTRADQLLWFQLLEQERENIVAALRYRCDVGDADGALRIATSLGGYAMMLGHHAEITGWVTDALAVPGATDAGLRLAAESLLALNSAASGEPGLASEDRETLRRLARDLGEIRTLASPLLSLLRPAVAFFAQEMALADKYLDEALTDPDEWSRAAGRMLRAVLAENDGDVETMRREGELGVVAFERLGERWGLANGLRVLGQIRIFDGELDGAADAYERALALSAELKSHDDEGYLLGKLAELEIRRGNLATAREYAARARRRSEDSGSAIEAIFATCIEGAVEDAQGNRERARELVREATRRVQAMPQRNPARGHLRAMVLAGSARMKIQDGDLEAATDLARDAYESGVGTKDLPVLAAVGVALAQLADALGDPERAATVLGAATRLRGADDPTSPDIRALTGKLRAELGDHAFEDAYAAGAALDRAAATEQLAIPG